MTVAEQYALELIRADRLSDARVRHVLAKVPIGLLLEVVVNLTSLANKPAQILREEHLMRGEWDEESARKAHAAWTRGVRDEWSIAGERYYQRERKRRVRRESAA